LTIYLVDEQFADMGLKYATDDPGARIVLLQDGVYVARSVALRGEFYVIRDDLTRRGLGTHAFPTNVHTIGYDDLVEMMEKDRVVCFL
jgi:sulfur relay protein TusB/DsrH